MNELSGAAESMSPTAEGTEDRPAGTWGPAQAPLDARCGVWHPSLPERCGLCLEGTCPTQHSPAPLSEAVVHAGSKQTGPGGKPRALTQMQEERRPGLKAQEETDTGPARSLQAGGDRLLSDEDVPLLKFCIGPPASYCTGQATKPHFTQRVFT